jgi:hypothetical protein
MAKSARIILGSFIGLAVGAAAAVALAVLAAHLFDISQAEGAYAMAVAFFYAPAGAIVGAIAGAVWVASRR